MPSRRSLLAALGAGFVTLLAAIWVGIWRFLPASDPVRLAVENYDDRPHTVTVEIYDDDEVAFADTFEIEASSSGHPRVDPVRTSREAVVERVGEYRAVAELDDGTTDEYALEPLDWRGTMPDLVVSIEGETGRLWVGGVGGHP